MVEKPEEEVKELLEQKDESNDEASKVETSEEATVSEESNSVVKVENNKSTEESVGQPVSIANATAPAPVEDTQVTINTEPMTTDKPSENKISFNDNDSMMNYNVNEKPTLIQKSESSLVSAPKTIERLEKISKEMNEKRKEEEAGYEDDDDDFGFEQDKIKIFDETPKLELDKLDVNDVSSGLKLESPPLLDDIEELS